MLVKDVLTLVSVMKTDVRVIQMPVKACPKYWLSCMSLMMLYKLTVTFLKVTKKSVDEILIGRSHYLLPYIHSSKSIWNSWACSTFLWNCLLRCTRRYWLLGLDKILKFHSSKMLMRSALIWPSLFSNIWKLLPFVFFALELTNLQTKYTSWISQNKLN